jgi:hypothetical protein
MAPKEPEEISPDNGITSNARSTCDVPSSAVGSIITDYDISKVNANYDAKTRSVGSLPPLSEKERLEFAKKILLCLFWFALVVVIGSGLTIGFRSSCTGNGDSELVKLVYEILDLTKTVVPSMVTLVLGFYFGRKDT